MPNLFQIVVCIAFSAFIFRYVRKACSLLDCTIILLLYTSFNLILFQPYILIEFSNLFGIGRGVDLFLYLSIFILFFMMIQLMLKIQKNREDISLLNSRISILLSERQDKLSSK